MPAKPLICADCGSVMVLRRTHNFQGGHMSPYYYGCSKWPKCDAVCWAAQSGEPMGVPATKEVRLMRRRAHLLLDRLTSSQYYQDQWKRKHLKTGHIGQEMKAALEAFILALEKELAWREHQKAQVASAHPELKELSTRPEEAK